MFCLVENILKSSWSNLLHLILHHQPWRSLWFHMTELEEEHLILNLWVTKLRLCFHMNVHVAELKNKFDYGSYRSCHNFVPHDSTIPGFPRNKFCFRFPGIYALVCSCINTVYLCSCMNIVHVAVWDNEWLGQLPVSGQTFTWLPYCN